MADQTSPSASVLLLEDDWDHRNVFRNFLEHRGWIVREATEADAARALLSSDPVDAIVIDLGGTNGWALLQELGARERRPRLLCLTGDARPESRTRAVGLGADAYLVKPIPLRTLAHAIETLAGTAPAAPHPAPRKTAAVSVLAPVAPIRNPRSTPHDGSRQRPVVLLLEDDDDARVIYRDMLDFAGYEVLAASDGEQGLRYAETRTPDIVVTDLHMPGMNGVEVARTLREEARTCPTIIAVTADSLGIEASRRVMGDRPLFDEVLVKPVSPGELVRTVRAYVGPAESGRR